KFFRLSDLAYFATFSSLLRPGRFGRMRTAPTEILDAHPVAPRQRGLKMTKIYYESDADLSVLDGQRVAVVGYGNQGRSWALNLRDSGLAVDVFTQADASRDQAEAEGFTAHEIKVA